MSRRAIACWTWSQCALCNYITKSMRLMFKYCTRRHTGDTNLSTSVFDLKLCTHDVRVIILYQMLRFWTWPEVRSLACFPRVTRILWNHRPAMNLCSVRGAFLFWVNLFGYCILSTIIHLSKNALCNQYMQTGCKITFGVWKNCIGQIKL